MTADLRVDGGWVGGLFSGKDEVKNKGGSFACWCWRLLRQRQAQSSSEEPEKG